MGWSRPREVTRSPQCMSTIEKNEKKFILILFPHPTGAEGVNRVLLNRVPLPGQVNQVFS